MHHHPILSRMHPPRDLARSSRRAFIRRCSSQIDRERRSGLLLASLLLLLVVVDALLAVWMLS